MRNLKNAVLSAYVSGIFRRDERRCAHDPDLLQKIMSEHGIAYVDHNSCNGFCPDCVVMHNCEAYEEIRDDWDGFYT